MMTLEYIVVVVVVARFVLVPVAAAAAAALDPYSQKRTARDQLPYLSHISTVSSFLHCLVIL